MGRPFDIVLYGATGFTGQLCATYLAKHAPVELRVALAGRDAAKLAAVKAALPGGGARFATIAAASPDELTALAGSTGTVLTTAGPYALFGEPLLRACAQQGTTYLDLTGESFWAQRMAAKYGDAAKASGALLVQLSGFDSVPADLGTWFLLRHARAAHGLRCASVTGVMVGTGNVSGGTIASAFNMMRSPGAAAEAADPLCLFPRAEAAAAGLAPQSIVAPLPDARALPFWEPGTGRWAGTFVMAAINSRVVRRSAGIHALAGAALAGHPHALPPLPPAPQGGGAAPPAASPPPAPSPSMRYSLAPFGYCEHLGLRSFGSALALNVVSGAMGLLGVIPGALGCAARYLPKPGEGPTPEQRARAHFRYYLVGETEPAAPAPAPAPAAARRRIVACVSGGDGGYEYTALMLCEAGMAAAAAAANGGATLPGRALGGGFLTPATAFGGLLVDRLHAAGMTFKIVTDEAL